MPTAPHEVLLVLDANQGQNALAQAEQFHAALGVTGLVLTKLDGTARGGIVVAIARKLGICRSASSASASRARTSAPSTRPRLPRRWSTRSARMITLRARHQALSQRARSAEQHQPAACAGRDGVPDRTLRRRQEHRAQADRAARAADARPRHRHGRQHRQTAGAARAGCFAGASAWCSRITGC